LIVFFQISEISDIIVEDMFHIALKQNRGAATDFADGGSSLTLPRLA